MSSADRIESAVYFTDRCGASIEVKRDMFASCGLTHGHDGAHEPVELGEQTTSESPAAAQDRGCLSEQAPDTVSGGGTPGTSSAAQDRYTVVVASTVEQATLVARREGLHRWKPATRAEHLRGYGAECRFIQVEPPLTDEGLFYGALDELRRLEGKGAQIELVYA